MSEARDRRPSSLSAAADPLTRAWEQGAISVLDLQFARRLARLFGETSPGMLWSLALVSRQESQGHLCADLPRLAEEGLLVEGSGAVRMEPALLVHERLEDWLAELRGSALVDFEADRATEPPGDAPRPLRLDAQGRLFLRRTHQAECALAEAVRGRAGATPDDAAVEDESLAQRVERLAPGEGPGVEAARAALRVGIGRRLAIVTGGPGTGKTTSVARIVGVLVERALESGRPAPRVRLMAPTGKAAAALANAFARGRIQLDVAESVRDALPVTAETIHRALYRQTRLDALGRPGALAIDADLVVVDEVSMVDLTMMTRLFEACVAVPRVILLGDPDQLASVEAGAVLAELCEVPPDSALARARVHLTHSHRFSGSGGIGQLAEAIRDGDAERALALLADPGSSEIERVDAAHPERVVALLAERTRALQRSIADVEGAAARLDRTLDHRVLCAHRRGVLGAETLAPRLEEVAARARNTRSRAGWWNGRLVMIKHNAPEQDLWNGDVGLVDDSEGELRAYFPAGRGAVRGLAAGRLPEHESAMAMTVHKSQGSEFETVDLVLGEHASPIMTRELLYTGVTRARSQLRIHASEAAIRAMIGRRVQRDSALGERLRAD